jgi:hypothetical protein
MFSGIGNGENRLGIELSGKLDTEDRFGRDLKKEAELWLTAP